MKRFNKTEKVIRWARDNRSRNIAHMITELGMTSEKQLMFHLNRVVRKGFVKIERIGQTVNLSLTKSARNGLYLLNVGE